MSRAGRPSSRTAKAALKAGTTIKATQGNMQRAINELKRPCQCGHARTIALDGPILSIVCPSCERVALRVLMRNAKVAARIWETMTGQKAA